MKTILTKLVPALFALAGALTFTLVLNLLVPNPGEPDFVSCTLSAFDFLGIAMLASLALYYHWRWQDGVGPAETKGPV